MSSPIQWSGRDGENPSRSSQRLQQVAALVGILAAISSLLLTLLGGTHRRLLLTLLVIAVVSLLWALFPQATRLMSVVRRVIVREILVLRQVSRLRTYTSKFEEFVGRNSGASLRSIVMGLCSNNVAEMDKILPRDYVPDWLESYKEQLRFRVFTYSRFHQLAAELTRIVGCFNRDYALAARQPLRANLQLVAYQHYQDEIEGFRDKYVRFLESFEDWLREVNARGRISGSETLANYFERPKIYVPPAPIEDRPEVRSKPEMRPPFNYYYQADDPVPMCPKCWESENKKIHLSEAERFMGSMRRLCRLCHEVYWE